MICIAEFANGFVGVGVGLKSELTFILNHTINFKIYLLSLLTLFVKALKMNNLCPFW